MIDVGIVNFRSYDLVDAQIKHWNEYIRGDFNIIVVDNTPKEERQTRPDFIPIDTDNSFDGISCGQATNEVVRQCKTDVICLIHPDFFFFNPNILFEMEELFKEGYQCIGPAGFYPDFQNNIDPFYPSQKGDASPTCWGSFFTKEFAQSCSFVCEPPGVGKLCGWEHRERIYKEGIKNLVWAGFFPFPDDNQICMFGDPEKPQGVHLLKGSAWRNLLMQDAMKRSMEYGLAKWQQ